MRNFLFNKNMDEIKHPLQKHCREIYVEIIGTMELKTFAKNKAEFSKQVKENEKRTSQIWGFHLSLSMFKISKTKKI